MKPEILSRFAADGFEILSGVLSPSRCETLVDELTRLHEDRKTTAGNRLGGLRNLLRLLPAASDLAHSSLLHSLLAERMPQKVFPVRALFFDKTPGANWRVGWHQDTTIAVKEKIETPGFEGWSVKEGITHVQASREVLEQMVTVRLHLDDCRADNGALKVVPGSHLNGKLNVDHGLGRDSEENAVICEVARGGLLLMRPLLLHASGPASTPSHRRVLHIEYAATDLPNRLNWYDR